jgi:flavin-dependent dehydrogenase
VEDQKIHNVDTSVEGGFEHEKAIRVLADPSSWNSDEIPGSTTQGRPDDRFKLQHGSRVAVIGGGPAGSMFSDFLLRTTRRLGIDIELDIFEPRDFKYCGPARCNHCGGVVSESLVQILGTEGIVFPDEVVQRGIDSYQMHMDVGDVEISAPMLEKRIAAVYRGNGPKNSELAKVSSFDHHLLERAIAAGATLHRQMVTDVVTSESHPRLRCADGSEGTYDLLVVASGINTTLLRIIEESGCGFRRPRGLKSFVCEFAVGREFIEATLGNSMHVFLLDIPRLQFAAMIPKGEYLTMVLLGDNLDEELIETFVNTEEVKSCLPQGEVPTNICQCFPRLNEFHARRPFDDRLVFIGDAGVARLYKDGIGSAYRTAKAAANCVALHGISRLDFKQYYWRACRDIVFDNAIGRLVFGFCHVLQKVKFMRRGVLRMTRIEQECPGAYPHMSSVLWDVFTGSAPYREVLLHVMHPGFICRLLWNMLLAILPPSLRQARGLQTP